MPLDRYDLGTFSCVPIVDWHFCWDLFGGASRDRTDGLVVANDALSQLSYSPTCGWIDCSTILSAIQNRYQLRAAIAARTFRAAIVKKP